MPLVTIVNRGNETFEVRPGRTLLSGAQEAGLPWRWYCGGQALCGTCCMLVVEGALEQPNDIERYFIEGWGYHSAYRLACQARVSEPVSVVLCGDEGYDRNRVLAAYKTAFKAPKEEG